MPLLQNPDSPEEFYREYEEFFCRNKTLYLNECEMEPRFYGKLIERFSSQLKNIEFNIICGPFIAVEDEDFRKYHKVHDDELAYWWFAGKRGEWWKAHPIFNKAYENKNIRINIINVTKKGTEPYFLIGTETNSLLIQEPHAELKESASKIYLNNREECRKYLEIWDDCLKKCLRWCGSNEILFKPRTIFEQENRLEKQASREFGGASLA